MRVLVIGGTGPSGPHLVNGLLARGHEVIILHGGFHEVEFDREIEHIHTDPHFAETLEPALAGRTFDTVIATYGRVRVIAETLRGRTGRFISVSGAGGYAPRSDERWGALGRPPAIREDGPKRDERWAEDKLWHKIWLTEQAVMAMHAAGDFRATIFRYPLVYGPHAPAPLDWSIVRRILDGRRQFILGDNGLLIQRWGYAANVAHALLLAVDQPEACSGQIYHVADDVQHSLRQRIELIARTLGHEWELVNLPQNLAARACPLWGDHKHMTYDSTHMAFDTTKVRTQLGYSDKVPTAEAIALSAKWLAAHGRERAAEMEKQLGDPFAYEAEDELIRRARTQGLDAAAMVEFPVIERGHTYRHPKKAGEDWSAGSAGTRA
ncbi:NAD-dependent epimerase/dehydratase family protein [Ramlibacter sp.]|uniref:NAD-dependent epimerase/dehydratase family protein n=1 Tax=Ramlibacter sp. TaxID=1917967 RepID=UPI003D0C017D